MIFFIVLSFIVSSTYASVPCVAWPSNCANSDSECANAIKNDIAAIAAGGKKADGSNNVDWGHASLNNCIFCAGQCWANPNDNIHCIVVDGAKRGETVEIREHYKRNTLAMCAPDQIQFLKVNLPGVGWVAGALTTGKTQASIVTTTTTHAGAVTVKYDDETLATEDTTADPNAVTTATVVNGNTPLPTAPNPLATGKAATTTVKATVVQACGKSSTGALLYPDKCGVCGGPSKTVCSAASTFAPSIAALVVVLLLAIVAL